MKLTVVGCSPAWPNPGGAQSGYLLEGPGRLLWIVGRACSARLRSNGNEPAGRDVDAIAISHFHLDHWGDLVPWVWGTMWGLGQDYAKPELWLPPGGREELAAFGSAVRDAGHVHPRVRAQGVRRGRGVRGGRAEARRDQAPALHGADVRLPRLEHHADARVLGRLGPERAPGEAGRGRRPLPVRGDAGAGRAGRRAAGASLGRRGRRRVRGFGGEAAPAHASPEGAHVSTTASSRRTTGSSSTSSSRRRRNRRSFGAASACNCAVTLTAGGGWNIFPTQGGEYAVRACG